MKPNELTPEALLKFFSELEGSGADDEECEIHYGCNCVIQKGRKAAEKLVEVQKILGVQQGQAPPALDEEAAMTAQIMEVERALTEPDAPPEADSNTEALSEAEGEIDRLLLQNVELKEQNGKLREKIRDLYKQIERLYTRSEMSKLLGTLDEKIEQESDGEGEDEPEADADAAKAPEPSEPEEVPSPNETAAAEAETASEAPAEDIAGEETASGSEAEDETNTPPAEENAPGEPEAPVETEGESDTGELESGENETAAEAEREKG